MYKNNDILFIFNLIFEVTRKCTQQCAHCMRGPMQNIDIDTKVIDAFFEQCEKYEEVFIEEIFFTGGEPLLNIDAIDYIIEKVKKSNWKVNVGSFGIITNGMVYNKKCEKTLLKLYNTVWRPEDCWMACSWDQFHIKPNEHNLKELSKLPFFDLPEKTILKKSDIRNIGLAKKNNLGCPKQIENKYQYPIRYTKVNGFDETIYFIQDEMFINSKGYILENVDGSYLFQDKVNLGNILIDDFMDLCKEIRKVKVRKKVIKKEIN